MARTLRSTEMDELAPEDWRLTVDEAADLLGFEVLERHARQYVLHLRREGEALAKSGDEAFLLDRAVAAWWTTTAGLLEACLDRDGAIVGLEEAEALGVEVAPILQGVSDAYWDV